MSRWRDEPWGRSGLALSCRPARTCSCACPSHLVSRSRVARQQRDDTLHLALALIMKASYGALRCSQTRQKQERCSASNSFETGRRSRACSVFANTRNVDEMIRQRIVRGKARGRLGCDQGIEALSRCCQATEWSLALSRCTTASYRDWHLRYSSYGC